MSDPIPDPLGEQTLLNPVTPVTPVTPVDPANPAGTKDKEEADPTGMKVNETGPATPIDAAGATVMVNASFGSHTATGHSMDFGGAFVNKVDATTNVYNNHSSSKPDPTIEYTKPTKLVELHTEDLEQLDTMAEELRINRLLVVSCSEFEVLGSAINALLDRPIFCEFAKQEFDEDLDKDLDRLKTFCDPKQAIGKGGESLIVLDVAEATELKSRPKLPDKLIERLGKVNRRLIYRIQTARNDDYGGFAHWHFDSLRYALPKYFLPEEAASIRQTLLAQWKAGKWNILESKNEFWEHIVGILRGPKGTESLRAEILRLSGEETVSSVAPESAGGKTGEAPAAEASPSGKTEPAELAPSIKHAEGTLIPGTPLASPLLERDKLSLAVLFTGTFFPNLSLHEFERALSIVMLDDTMKATDSSGRLLRKLAPSPKKLSDLWKENGDTYLRDCQLQLWNPLNERRFMEFTVPVRPWLQREYESSLPRYTFERWSRVLSSGWLFEVDISAHVQRDLLRMAMRATQLAPETYGKNLLFSVLRGLGEYVRTIHQQGQSELARSMDEDLQGGVRTAEDFRRLVELVFRSTEIWGGEARKKTNHIYRRLAQLCRTMLEEPKLGGTVHEFFLDLLAIKQFDPILAIGEQLRGIANFDYVLWLRRILDDSKASHIYNDHQSEHQDDRAKLAQVTRARIYDWLLRQMIDSSEGAIEVLNAVRSWLPPAEKESDQFTYSECYALTLPLRFSAATDRTDELWEKGIHATSPSNPQLDRWADVGGTDSATVLAEIQNWGNWLCHRGLGAAAKLHGLDSILGQIQKGQTNRWRILGSLREEAKRLGLEPPNTEDLSGWERFLRAMSAAADEEDLAAFQIAETLRRWALAVSPLTGQAPKGLAALLDQLLHIAATNLKPRRSLLTKVDRSWSDSMEQLLKLLGTIDSTKENQRTRVQVKGVRSVTYYLRKSFQDARSAVAAKAAV